MKIDFFSPSWYERLVRGKAFFPPSGDTLVQLETSVTVQRSHRQSCMVFRAYWLVSSTWLIPGPFSSWVWEKLYRRFLLCFYVNFSCRWNLTHPLCASAVITCVLVCVCELMSDLPPIVWVFTRTPFIMCSVLYVLLLLFSLAQKFNGQRCQCDKSCSNEFDPSLTLQVYLQSSQFGILY